MTKKLYKNHELYFNRELSWLEFNDRVLQEARNKLNPLFERLKFLSIVSSNLDEFFMVRVASLKDQVNAGYHKPDIAGLTPQQQLQAISDRAHKMVREQSSLFRRSLLPAAAGKGLRFNVPGNLNSEQSLFLENYFKEIIYPVLTPMAVDSSRPFPLIMNRSLNIGAIIKQKKSKANIFATVQVPSVLSRIIELPGNDAGDHSVVLMEDVIIKYIRLLFTGYEVICTSPYRITRNAGLTLEEEEAEDLLMEIEKSLKKRKWGAAIRLEVDHEIDDRLLRVLKNALEISDEDLYRITGPIDLTCLMRLYSLDGFRHLKYSSHIPQIPPEFLKDGEFGASIFETISAKDVFVHHPFDSFEPVLEFVRTAARDPDVLAIKQTLYRVSGDSPIVAALAEAAEKGKQVTVLVELKARFDEENNINWAKRLEQAGCHVIYGLVGLKTHCKVILVVRIEEDGIKRYIHLGTGNYNDITARFYTDMGLFTANEQIGADASAIFNLLTGYSEPPDLYRLEFAPYTLRKAFLALIDRETENAQCGRKAKIIAKMNSLVDGQIIEALYKASTAGVQIDLIIRGICCLKPAIPDISDNINVVSIVGRFLEHSRVFYFYNDGAEEVYLSSADWMPRNLDRRIEILFPVEALSNKKRIIDVLHISLHDTSKARMLGPDGKYRKRSMRGQKPFNSQDYLISEGVLAAAAMHPAEPEIAAATDRDL